MKREKKNLINDLEKLLPKKKNDLEKPDPRWKWSAAGIKELEMAGSWKLWKVTT